MIRTMSTRATTLRGRLDEHVVESVALRGNPLGNPHARPLWVYTPPSYAGGPTVYVLQGFTGRLEMWRRRRRRARRRPRRRQQDGAIRLPYDITTAQVIREVSLVVRAGVDVDRAHARRASA